MDQIALTHRPIHLHDTDPQGGQTVELDGYWESAEGKQYFGRQVSPTGLSSCQGCVWRKSDSDSNPFTCSGMSSGTQIELFSRSNATEEKSGIGIPAKASLVFRSIADKLKYLKTLKRITQVEETPYQTSTLYEFPRFLCAQPTEVTVPLAEITPEL